MRVSRERLRVAARGAAAGSAFLRNERARKDDQFRLYTLAASDELKLAQAMSYWMDTGGNEAINESIAWDQATGELSDVEDFEITRDATLLDDFDDFENFE